MLTVLLLDASPDPSIFGQFGPWGICLVLLLAYAWDQRSQNRAKEAVIAKLNEQMTSEVVPALTRAVDVLHAVEKATREQ